MNKNKFKRRSRSNGLIRNRSSNIPRFHLASYPTRTVPSTFGPGTYKLAISKLISGSLENEVVVDIYADVIYQNPEFERIRSDFKYFKLEGVTVTFFSRNLPIATNQKPAYFIVNFDGYKTENMRLQDCTKIVPAFLQRSKRFRFNIPRLNTYAGALNNWMTESDLNAYGQIWIQIHAPDNTTEWNFRVDAIIIARGPTAAASGRKNEMKIKELKYCKLNDAEEMKSNLKEIKEEYEEEEKENENNKDEIIDNNKKNVENNKDLIRNIDENKEEYKENIEELYEDDDWFSPEDMLF